MECLVLRALKWANAHAMDKNAFRESMAAKKNKIPRSRLDVGTSWGLQGIRAVEIAKLTLILPKMPRYSSVLSSPGGGAQLEIESSTRATKR